MNHRDHWEIVEEIGYGGQGKVFLARDRRTFDINKTCGNVCEALRGMSSNILQDRTKEFNTLLTTVDSYVAAMNPAKLAALKVLHAPQDARDSDRARERIKRELAAMSKVSHPNLLCVREADPDGQWFAAEYHSRGALTKCLGTFRGDFPRALKAFRGLVDGVAKLHADQIVHRDIKPDNIFVTARGELVLGDFGLIFFTDNNHTRLSGTLQNVGTRDWMPGWAMGMRIEEVRPSFDVFSLGKTLWALVSGDPFLQLWYFDKPQFDLERKFPESTFIGLANKLLAKCVVEDEENCLRNANDLLAEIDKVLRVIDRDGQLLGDGIKRCCRVCGVGEYERVPDVDIDNSPLRKPAGRQVLRVFTCNHCGHVQTFLFRDQNLLPAWNEAPTRVESPEKARIRRRPAAP